MAEQNIFELLSNIFSASHLTEVLEDHVDVGVALGVGEEGPGPGDGLGVILQLYREPAGGAEKGRDQEG